MCAALRCMGLIVSCTKEVNELTACDPNRRHTFGAKVDGKFWMPAGFSFFPDNDILVARKHSPMDFFISMPEFLLPLRSKPNLRSSSRILNGPGTYALNTDVTYPTTSANYGYFVRRNFTPNGEWITSSQFDGSITITAIDTVKQFVSGTFFFQCPKSNDGGDPLSVTEGRFDVSTKVNRKADESQN